jgi:uncharacterized protein (TIGR02996 family)
MRGALEAAAMSHEAFLQAVRANPDDDTPRLVYADWLDEQGDADRAEFIRVQCEAERLDIEDPRGRILKHRESALLRANWERWTAPLRGLSISIRQELTNGFFRRGFIDDLWLDAPVFVDRAAELFESVFLTGVSLSSVGPLATRLGACPWLTRLHSLGFRYGYRDPLDPAGARALAASRHVTHLRCLRLIQQNIGDVGLRALAAAPWMAWLRVLRLFDCGLSHDGVRGLTESPMMPRLHHLALASNQVGDEGAVALARCDRLGELRHLQLSGNGIGERGARALLGSPHLGRLEYLNIGAGILGAAEVRELTSSKKFRYLCT